MGFASVYEIIKTLLLNISIASLTLVIFPENMKIAKMIPTFETGRKGLVPSKRSISTLCFF